MSGDVPRERAAPAAESATGGAERQDPDRAEGRIIPPREGRAIWAARWGALDVPAGRAPSDWVMARLRELPPGALVVDLAGGDGRHAIPATRLGHHVVLLDFAERAVMLALEAESAVMGVVADTLALPLRPGAFDAVLIVNFLERALFPHLPSLLRPGGRLIVETFHVDHMRLVAEGRARGPRNPAYMLERGELPRLALPLRPLEYREEIAGDGPGARAVARLVAERPAPSR